MLSLFLSIAAADIPPPIVNGEATDDFIQVGAIMGYHEEHGGFPFCSGTLIHEEWVVTAAHCVEAVEEYHSYGMEIWFVLGDNLFNSSGTEDYDNVIEWEIHPEYVGSNNYLGADIGLLKMESGFANIEPIPLNEEAPSVDWQGVVFDYVGWGVTGDGREDSGIKRHALIPYYNYDDIFIYSYDSNTNLCSGDSGGAALQETEDGYTLAGVNSFVFSVEGSQPCEGGGSGATRIDAHIDWIREFVPEPSPPEQEAVVDEEELEEANEDQLDGDDDKLLAGCSTGSPNLSLGQASPYMLLLSVLLLVIRRER